MDPGSQKRALAAEDLAPDALGNAEGVLYRMALEPPDGHRFQLSNPASS